MDRGCFSVEVLLVLYAFLLNQPSQVFLLRGNHECRGMTSHMNFRAECLAKYDQQIYSLFMDSFDLLPLACVVNAKYFAVHGGISPHLRYVGAIHSRSRTSTCSTGFGSRRGKDSFGTQL